MTAPVPAAATPTVAEPATEPATATPTATKPATEPVTATATITVAGPATATESATTTPTVVEPATVAEPAAVAVPVPEPVPTPASVVEGEPAQGERQGPSEIDVSLRVLLALFAIGFGVWVVFAWMRYDKDAGQTEQGWHKGSRQLVEVTLVREDVNKLACASNLTVEGLNCGYFANSQPRVPPPQDDAHLLRPYCNVKNEVLLASGLWSSPGMRGLLPTDRFTVVCNYDIVGAIKSVALRFSPTDKFEPTKQSLPVGILTDCVIPQ